MIWRRKRMMRLHLLQVEGQHRVELSIEGIFLGFEAGHYKLASARHIETSERTHTLDGIAWVPRTRVLYAQEVSA